MTIYLDIVFIENLILNYIIIYSVSVILKKPKKYIRIFFGSLIGAIYTVVTYFTGITVYSNVIFKFILSIVIVYISFSPQNIKGLWKDLLYFYLITFVFGGVVFGFIYIVRPQDIFLENEIGIEVIIVGAIIAFVLVILGFKIIKNRLRKKEMFCDIRIKINNKMIETKAMIDTGNFLKEPITGKSVIIIEHTLLYEIIPKQILNNLEGIIGGDFSNVAEEIKNEYITRLKLIPFSSLGKQNGMLIGINVDNVEVLRENESIKLEKQEIMIGIYNKSLTKNGEYRALIGIGILDK